MSTPYSEVRRDLSAHKPKLKLVRQHPQRSQPKKVNVARSVVGQVRLALRPENRLASFLGAVLGGFVPLSTYVLSHSELPQQWYSDTRTAIVAGGLLYSAKTVLQWGKLAFGDRWKALGFVVLTEGVMVLSHTYWLSGAALAVLMGINAVATAVALSALDNRE